MNKDIWYQCDRCGACCKWPGDVRVDDQEIAAIAEFLGIELDDFIQNHTRLRMNRDGLSLLEKENHVCSMLENGKCKIQPVKPFQCKGFPNRWNFPGWQEICHAKPVPMAEAIKLGLVEEGEVSANVPIRGRDLDC